jgi:hypothetical protein
MPGETAVPFPGGERLVRGDAVMYARDVVLGF